MSQKVTTDAVRLEVTCLREGFLEQYNKRATREISPGEGFEPLEG